MFDRIRAFLDQHRDQRDQAFAEAAIELLLLCMYADKDLTIGEREFIERYAEALPWHSSTPKERFIGAAYARVREINAKGLQAQFIDLVAKRVPKAEDRMRLYTACHQLMRADLDAAPVEKAFLAGIKAGLGI